MALPFGPYQGQDLTSYEEGNKFLPRQFYSLGFPNTPPPSIANASTGITNTQAAVPYKWPPEGGDGGGGFSNTNKFGLNMDTLKTVTGGQWSTDNNPFGYGSYKETPRQIAQTEGGIWKDINTNQNVYHGNIDYRGIVGTIADKVLGRKSRPGFPDEGSWTGADWDEDFDPRFAGTRLNTYQRWKEKRNIVKAQEKAAADKVAASKAAVKASGADVGHYDPQAGGASHMTRGRDQGGLGLTQSQAESIAEANKDVGGWGLAEGGRIGYERGRVVNPGGYAGNLLDIFTEDDLWLLAKHKYDANEVATWKPHGRKDLLKVLRNPNYAQGGLIGYFDGGIAGLL